MIFRWNWVSGKMPDREAVEDVSRPQDIRANAGQKGLRLQAAVRNVVQL